MEFMELMGARRSVRRYRGDAVPAELERRILEAVRSAPTAGNFQSYEVYVVRGESRMRALAAATFSHDWIAEAPMALVVCSHPARCQYEPGEHWALQDASIAATMALLAIADLGLASCWVGAFVPAKVAAVVEAAEGHIPLAVLPVGYANEIPQETVRRSLEEFVHRRE